MSKKLILAVGILVSAPFALLNCSASGAGSIGDDDASSRAGDRSENDPVETETTTTRTTTTTTESDD